MPPARINGSRFNHKDDSQETFLSSMADIQIASHPCEKIFPVLTRYIELMKVNDMCKRDYISEQNVD